MPNDSTIADPTSRKLRIFSFDPSISNQIATSDIGDITIDVLWERGVLPGPIGEYVEVVDVDPASGVAYAPIDLNDARVLAQNGLPPSETNPMFHQQMVYAVAMATIGQFEQALGRVAFWSDHRPDPRKRCFVRRLRIYPHALRDRNAYYSPDKKALLFGYFPVTVKDPSNTPGTMVFTCLSHDIIAHETTHALLDGVHPRFNMPYNPDVLAFHEAFADLVALFQRFAYPGVLRSQISRTRGELGNENMLAQLAQQFGKASGRGSALRDALGARNPATGRWEPHQPDVHRLARTHEPHARGAILVAAVFGAFLKVYRRRIADLYRIATEGTGVLRPGEIHPDLANRLADEAARCAQRVLQMIIRAIDYCPPVGITFGDYLRAIVTADHDWNADDPEGYRLAFVESFQQWGISPEGMRSMSADALLWPGLDMPGGNAAIESLVAGPKSFDGDDEPMAPMPRSRFKKMPEFRPFDTEADRYDTWVAARNNARFLWSWLVKGDGQPMLDRLGLVRGDTDRRSIFLANDRQPAIEVHSVRTAFRRGRRGPPVPELVVTISQRRRGYFDESRQADMDRLGPDAEDRGDFRFRAGCTLLLDPLNFTIRRVIRTAGRIDDDEALGRVRRFLDQGMDPASAFAPRRMTIGAAEPFALLHRHDGEHAHG